MSLNTHMIVLWNGDGDRDGVQVRDRNWDGVGYGNEVGNRNKKGGG